MTVYTRKGDKGETSLFESNPKKRCRVSKSSSRIKAIGAIDELNSYLGVANVHVKSVKTIKSIKLIQRNLFTIGSILSKAPIEFKKSETRALERKIDALEEKLPPLKNFLMPEGSTAAVHLMYARALARRAERRVVVLSHRGPVPENVLSYINRLSDYLFCLFRDENANSGEREEIWVGTRQQ